MRLHAVLVLAVGFLLAADAPKDKEAAVKKDLAKFEGTWVLVALERNGQKVPEEEIEKLGLRATFKGHKFTVKEAERTVEGTMTIDPTKKPKTFDAKGTDSEGRTQEVLGIYEFEDSEKVKVCFVASGKERPTEFESTPGSGRVLAVYMKEKAKKE